MFGYFQFWHVPTAQIEVVMQKMLMECMYAKTFLPEIFPVFRKFFKSFYWRELAVLYFVAADTAWSVCRQLHGGSGERRHNCWCMKGILTCKLYFCSVMVCVNIAKHFHPTHFTWDYMLQKWRLDDLRVGWFVVIDSLPRGWRWPAAAIQ